MVEIKRTKSVVIKQTVVDGKVVSEERKEQVIVPAKDADEIVDWGELDEAFEHLGRMFKKKGETHG